MRRLTAALLFTWLTTFSTCFALADAITIDDPWIREAPPGVAMLAAYMTISNKSGDKVVLRQASSPDFKKVEMHLTKMQEGMSHMLKQVVLQIGPNENIILEPGGKHLMLMKPQRQLKAGDTVQLQLKFDNGEDIAVQAVVRRQ